MLILYLAAFDTDEDRVKFENIYNEYKDLMAKTVRKYTSSIDDAEDIVHDAFLEIIGRKELLFDMPCRSLRRYIVSIVRSKCVNRFRRESKLTQESLDNFIGSLSNEDSLPEKILIDRESSVSLQKALQEIDENSRVILEMKYVLNLSYVEISKKLGISTKNVDVRLMRAKERLRRALERSEVK